MAYEVVVGILVKVWKRLEEDAVKFLADGIRGLAGRGWAEMLGWFSPFRRRYLNQLVFDHRDFNVRGLLTIGTYNLRLEQAFVELRISPGEVHKARTDPVSAQNPQLSRTIWDFLRGDGESPGAWAIIGPPGSGKTTLLQNVTVLLAKGLQGRQRLRSQVPLLLFLRDHTKVLTEGSPPSLGGLAEEAVANRKHYGKPPPGWFEAQLQRGSCLVMLDGLDEVADEGLRRKVRDWVDEQIVRYPLAAFLLTARPHGYRSAPLQRARAVLEVQSFGREQVERFVRSWYLANEVMGAGHQVDQGIRQQATERAEDLLRRLGERPQLLALTSNPLLLTMIATVHRYRGALPGRRVELYSEICDVFLGHWRAARGIAVRLTAAQTRSVLQPVAAWLMSKRQRDMGTQEAMARMRDGLEQVGLVAAEVEGFLPELQGSSGLLVEREHGQWSFAHLTFQEYLCAAHWQVSGPPAKWEEYVGDPWWHETRRPRRRERLVASLPSGR